MNMTMSLNYSGDQLFIPNIVRAIGQASMLAPLTCDHARRASPRRTPRRPPASSQHVAQPRRRRSARPCSPRSITKREQYHSNIIGQSVTISAATRCGTASRDDRTISWRTACPIRRATAIRRSWRSATPSKRQALVMGFSDTFAVIGMVLALAGIAILLTGKPKEPRRQWRAPSSRSAGRHRHARPRLSALSSAAAFVARQRL